MSTTSAGARGRSSKGLFITFEGPDGSGKSTQARMLAERLKAEGRAVLETLEPGGTSIGLQIRRILLDAANREMMPTTELMLMFAARAQNVEQRILPALERGEIVICDRFTDSSLAYQGAGRDMGSGIVLELDRIACHGLTPDITLCIDIDVETGLARALKRESDAERRPELRFEQQTIEFHRNVREAYHEIAKRDPRRFRLIDGSGTPESIAAGVWEQVAPLIR